MWPYFEGQRLSRPTKKLPYARARGSRLGHDCASGRHVGAWAFEGGMRLGRILTHHGRDYGSVARTVKTADGSATALDGLHEMIDLRRVFLAADIKPDRAG